MVQAICTGNNSYAKDYEQIIPLAHLKKDIEIEKLGKIIFYTIYDEIIKHDTILLVSR